MYFNLLYAACDKACKDSCSGEGADMCDECAKGYELTEEERTCEGRWDVMWERGVREGKRERERASE